MQCASSIQSLSAPSTKWTSLCLMLSSQKQGGASKMWVILLEYLVDGIGIFVNVFVAVFPMLFLCGRNGFRGSERFGSLALAFEMDFWGVPKFMNSGFRIVGIIWSYITLFWNYDQNWVWEMDNPYASNVYPPWIVSVQQAWWTYRDQWVLVLWMAAVLRCCFPVAVVFALSARCLQKSFRSLPFSFCATSFGRQHFCYICCSTLPSTCAWNRTAWPMTSALTLSE